MSRGRTSPAPDREVVERDEPSRWTKSGTGCAIALVAMLIISGGIIGWSRLRSGSQSRAGRPPAATVPASDTLPAAAHQTGEPAPSSPTPTHVTWLQVGLGALPFSATAGPTLMRAGVPSGFAHTLAGAVEAAIQILGRLSWSAQSRAAMQSVVSASTTPAAQAQVVVGYGPPTDPSVIPQLAGFQIVTYSSTQAVVNLALRFNGTLRVSPAALQWSDAVGGAGDWKLAGAPGPLSRTSWAAVDDLTGYILFSGQPTKVGD